MFPNLRLLIGALAASVAALCCGFGVFAAFRVNHEPLSRLPAATAPLQLVINDAAAPRPAWSAPVGGLVPLNVSDVPTARSAPSSVRPAATEAAQASTAAVKTTAVVDAPQQHASLPPTQTAPPAEMLPTKSQAPAPSAAANESASAAPGHSVEAPAEVVAAIDLAPAPSGAQPAEDSVPMPEARPALPAKVRKAVAEALERRRIAARKRLVRKPRAPVVAQFGGDTSTFHDPVFQSAPDTQSSPAARTRSTKTTANSGATSNSFAWPNAQ